MALDELIDVFKIIYWSWLYSQKEIVEIFDLMKSSDLIRSQRASISVLIWFICIDLLWLLSCISSSELEK
jgi:hypothetical protein